MSHNPKKIIENHNLVFHLTYNYYTPTVDIAHIHFARCECMI